MEFWTVLVFAMVQFMESSSLPLEKDLCQHAQVLSTCRLPTHYSGRSIDFNYYRKLVDANGIPILGSRNVSSAALVEAARIISRMLDQCPTRYAEQVVLRGDRVVVLGRNEKLHDLPEFRNRAADRKLLELRGYNSMGVIVCAEENLLCEENDDYRGYSVCMHEFAHALDASFTKVDPAYKRLVVTAFRAASEDRRRIWANTYAASDPAEYFAELSVAWFDASSKDVVPGSFNGIWSRDLLKGYDQFMSDLLKRIYGDEEWRYSCADVCSGPFFEDLTC